ncbi:AI-2E family transporter [Micrococcus sp.]|uniref:AI-2E family transporter n=1 Tax=Micrococcus sp. TaxID=1271 RepID=UPI002A9166BE|nr:AI-2E family transporter [Micrococcus sp.]MDY6055367.1 AI-2E family transporter [Micrococcus sp.]
MSSTLAAQTKINKDVPYGLTVAAAWSWRFVAIVVMVGVVWWLASFVSLIVVPVIVAMLLAVLLSPIYRMLRRGRVPAVLAALSCVLLLISVVVGLFWVAGHELVNGFAALGDQLVSSAQQFAEWLSRVLAEQGFQFQLDASSLDAVWNTARQNSSTIVDGALSFGSTAANIVTGTFIALFTLVFFLFDGDRVWRFALLFVPKANRARVDVAGRSGWEALGSYVRVQIFVAFIDAVGIGVGAWLLGVPLALPIAVLVFLASFIPMVGAVLTGALAVVVALVSNGLLNAVLMLVVVLLVQQLESNVLQPLVMGKAVSLHPLAVFLAVAAGSVVMGIVGAVFAVPLLAFLNAFIRALDVKDEDEPVEAGEEVFRPVEEAVEGAREDAQLDPDMDPDDLPGIPPRGEGEHGSARARVVP